MACVDSGADVTIASLSKAVEGWQHNTLNFKFFSFHLQSNVKTYGARDFAISASELWNQLADDIRPSDNLTTFKWKLKTYFFQYRFEELHWWCEYLVKPIELLYMRYTNVLYYL